MGAVTGAVGSIVGSAVDPLTGALTTTNKYQAQIPPEVLARQNSLAEALSAQMRGEGPSVAEQQYKNNLNQIAAQQAGAIASQKGISPGLAARLISNQGAQAQMQGAGQAAALRAGEQLGAMGQLQNLTAQQGNQALGFQNLNANIAQQNANAQNQVMQGILQGASGAITGGAVGKYDGGMVSIADALMQRGGMVPGMPMVQGDSPKNDTVHAILSPGEIVIPRSLAEDPERAKRFIEEIKEKTKKSGYGKVLEAKRKK